MDECKPDKSAVKEINRLQMLCPWSSKCKYGVFSTDPKVPKLKIKDFDVSLCDPMLEVLCSFSLIHNCNCYSIEYKACKIVNLLQYKTEHFKYDLHYVL